MVNREHEMVAVNLQQDWVYCSDVMVSRLAEEDEDLMAVVDGHLNGHLGEMVVDRC